jgi:hypothetical protein
MSATPCHRVETNDADPTKQSVQIINKYKESFNWTILSNVRSVFSRGDKRMRFLNDDEIDTLIFHVQSIKRSLPPPSPPTE